MLQSKAFLPMFNAVEKGSCLENFHKTDEALLNGHTFKADIQTEKRGFL